MIGRSENPSLSGRPLQALGLTNESTVRLFNAGLALTDDKGLARPYLAETLPQLNTDTWKVFPDGSMETTYKLRSGLTWHDGAPLTSDDFLFAYEVSSVPELGQSTAPPLGLIEELTAPDPATVLIHWRRLYKDAGALTASGGSTSPTLPPLPRHLLDEAFRQGNWDNFISMPQWSSGFVGAGPYKVDRWEHGAFLEASAFDGHVLGRPKIDRVRVSWSPDFNATVSTMLAGEGHITVDDSIRFQQAMILKREWSTRSGGVVLVYPSLWRWITIQQRPEYVNPRALLDQRVRKALAYGVDKAALNDVLFEAEGIMTEVPVAPNETYFPEVDRASVKYPYQPQQVEQLMADAGFTKDAGGVYTSQTGGRMSTELSVFQSPQNESEMSIIAASWRQLGFETKENVWAATLARDNALRNMHPNVSVTSGPSGDSTLLAHASSELPRADNRWIGTNRGAWTNPEFDRLASAYNGTLVETERVQLLSQMARIFSDDVAVISLYFNPTTTAVASGLRGPGVVVPAADVTWNVYDWEWTQ
jgi:peptide/nickel transport system substrate-binding protein